MNSSPTLMKSRFMKRFEGEIQQLERELKTDLPKEIKTAREHGDLRENAEYKAAKERQSFVQARLGMLRQRLAEISLMNFDKLPRDRAAFGSSLQLQDPQGGQHSYRLVLPEDVDPERGWISAASPIGRALVGKEVGDQVNVPTPAGTRQFEIVKLVTIHDEP